MKNNDLLSTYLVLYLFRSGLSKIKQILIVILVVFLPLTIVKAGGTRNLMEISQQQKKQISGLIRDVNNQPLIGVNIIEIGTTNGTVTDMDGKFSLNVLNNATIKVSYLGYLEQDINISEKTNFNITLVEDTRTLDELVVIGYGTQKKVNLTGAIGVANSERLEDRAITSVGRGLQGVIPGLNITYTSGNPNESAKFNIRGFESINGGEPLILVDGIPMNIERINPDDIESISVLKDASSAAIYGARASFGVILVTTKKGKMGKTNISFSSQFSMQKKIFPGYEPVREGGTSRKIMNQARKVTFGSILYPEYVVDAAMAYQELSNPRPEDAWYRADNYIYYLGTNYPKDLAMRNFSPQQRYNFNISGANEKASYYVSLGAIDKRGFLKYNSEDFNKYDALFKLDYNVNQWITLEEKLSYSAIQNTNPHDYNNYNMIGTLWFSVPSEFPDLEYYKEPGDRAKYEQYIGIPSRHNLAAYLKSGAQDLGNENEILFSQKVILSPLEGLKLIGDFSYYGFWNKQKRVASEVKMSNSVEVGYNLNSNLINPATTASEWIDFTLGHNQNVVLNTYGEYTVPNIGNHYLKALLGFNQENFKSQAVNTRSTEIITPSTPSLSATTGVKTNSESGGEYMLRGLFYRLNYSFKDKYLFETNGRYDGTSKFPSKSRFGFFPSFSAGWRLSEEPFMDITNNWLLGLKLRASYGKLGNQNVGSYYPYISVMTPGTSAILLDGNNSFLQTMGSGNLVSDKLTWETIISKNIGIDFTIPKLDVSFDYFIRDTKDMLMKKTYPGILGTTAPQENAADLRNKGWELSATWNSKLNEDWLFRINLVLSDYQTTITKYDNPTGAINDYYVGKKIGEIWGYKTVGLFQTEDELTNAADQSRLGSNWKLGDVHYADLNNDGVISTGNNTLENTGDRIRIGNSTPRYSFGLNPNIKYKNFSFDIFFQGVLKRDWNPTTSNSVRFFPFKYMGMEKWWIEDSWSPENVDGYFPGIQFMYSDSKNVQSQTRWLQNAAYLRLKSMTLSYNLPLKFFESSQIFLNGENLWEVHGMYKSLDPEFPSDLSQRYFFHRSLTLGIKLTL